MNWKPTRGRCIVKLRRVERAMEVQEGEISYFCEVAAMGATIDHEPEFKVGDNVKLEQVVGYRWDHEGESYLVTPFHNIELVCDEILDVTEQTDNAPDQK
jgi:co-chaperonin GroES (HSP10)